MNAVAPVQSKGGVVVARRTAITMASFTVLALAVLVVFGRDGTSTWSLDPSSSGDEGKSHLTFDVRVVGVVVGLGAALLTAVSVWLTLTCRRTPGWLKALFSILLLIGFLSWSTSGHTLPLIGLLAGSLALSVPLIFGALGGVVSERVGVVNVAIEGQMLAGAFVSALVASATGSAVVGVAASAVAGIAVAFVLAAFSIRYLVDQVIVGIVLNMLVLGLTSFIYNAVYPSQPQLNLPPQLEPIAIPGLSSIPVLGPVLFKQTIIVYLMYVVVALVFVGIHFTKWGLRLRAVGEHPQAAETVGINVARTRFLNVSLAGAIAGLGGAYFTLGSVGSFSLNVTSGAGYIALAAVIFGRWNPIQATLAALLFGFTSNLQNVLGILGSPLPSDFMLTLPYLVTIFAVAGLVGYSRGPAAAGKPYIKS